MLTSQEKARSDNADFQCGNSWVCIAEPSWMSAARQGVGLFTDFLVAVGGIDSQCHDVYLRPSIGLLFQAAGNCAHQLLPIVGCNRQHFRCPHLRQATEHGGRGGGGVCSPWQAAVELLLYAVGGGWRGHGPSQTLFAAPRMKDFRSVQDRP